MRLYLPESWADDPSRRDQAGVPPGFRRGGTKGESAPDPLDPVRNEGLPGPIVVTDAGSGVAQEFRERRASRGLYFAAGVTEDLVVFEAKPSWIRPSATGRGRPRSRARRAEDHPRPEAVRERARRLPRPPLSWREGTQGALSAQFRGTRVGPAHGWATGECAEAGVPIASEQLWNTFHNCSDATGTPVIATALTGAIPQRRPLGEGQPQTRASGRAWLST
jgi:SRSO17 transposase